MRPIPTADAGADYEAILIRFMRERGRTDGIVVYKAQDPALAMITVVGIYEPSQLRSEDSTRDDATASIGRRQLHLRDVRVEKPERSRGCCRR